MEKIVTRRKFLGELFPKKENRKFENAHLKAYLKGFDYFYHGFDLLGNRKKYLVQQQKQISKQI